MDKHTVDIDSSVISRFVEQEGISVGYNPKRHGRPSHHLLIAFSAEVRMVIQPWMRTGDSASATCFDGSMDDLYALPSEKLVWCAPIADFQTTGTLNTSRKGE
jgi:hypothetical protein